MELVEFNYSTDGDHIDDYRVEYEAYLDNHGDIKVDVLCIWNHLGQAVLSPTDPVMELTAKEVCLASGGWPADSSPCRM